MWQLMHPVGKSLNEAPAAYTSIRLTLEERMPLLTRKTLQLALFLFFVFESVWAQERNLTVQQVEALPQARLEQRIALVIGNGAYSAAPLSNPANDAKAMAEALKAAGFLVTLKVDISHRDFLGVLREFGDRLRAGGVGVFYYAGHGMQIKGRNYLIPVDAAIQREDEVAYLAVDAQSILDKMEAAGNSTNLMILDACRNNPFARSFRSANQGLAQMDAPVGTLVAFATSPGSVASDGGAQNGLYTQHLLNAIRVPGNRVEDVFKQTRAAVRRESQGRQIPWESTSLEGDFFFVPAIAPPVVREPTKADAADALERELWSAVTGSRDSGDLRAYVRRYPNGRFIEAAKAELAALNQAANPLPISRLDSAASEVRPVHAVRQDPVSPLPTQNTSPGEPTLAQASARGRPLVGDTWYFQTIDKYKGQPVATSEERVASVDAEGNVVIGNADPTAPAYWMFARSLLRSSQEGYPAKAGQPLWWSDMRPGESRTVRFLTRVGDRSLPPVPNNVSLRLRMKERIKVPAGEFEAIRLDAEGTSEFSELTYGRLQHWTLSAWYVPSLRNFVAMELDARYHASSGDRVRVELTRYAFADGKSKPTESAPPQPAVSALAPQRLQADGNKPGSNGFLVGDKWNFQIVDKWKGEVVSNRASQVVVVKEGGDVTLSDDALDTPIYWQFVRDLLKPSISGHVARVGAPLWWSDMKAGDTRGVTFETRRPDRFLPPLATTVSMKHKGREKVTVPAGDFDAIRIECEGTTEFPENTYYNRLQQWSLTVWYSPGVRQFVAAEVIVRPGAGDRTRRELTSYELRGTSIAAKQ
jgi:uncharacterized caspase-like protein